VKRRNRILLVVAATLACVGTVVGLTHVSSGASGPLASVFNRIGAMVAGVEHGASAKLHGGGRADRLRWLAPYRDDAAKLRAPDRILLGAYDSGIPATLEGVAQLEQLLDTSLPLIQIYTAFGDKPEEQFPEQLAQAIWNAGSIPLVTWEPWLADFESNLHPDIPLRERRDEHGLAAMSAGAYDFYIDAWAAQAKRFGHPMFVRFGHEMNDPYRYPWGPQHNTKEEYIAAWRHIVDRFRAAGATNVLWVWSPHVAYKYFELYYPGDAYVDWVATGALNFGPIAQWSQWWTFAEIFGQKYPILARFRKPVMVAEFGSLAVGGDRAKWYRDALASLPKRYPGVRALLFFNASGDQTVTYQKVDWTLQNDSATARAVRESVAGWDKMMTPR
jgi:hypothetical protein